MEDSRIIALFFERSEEAVKELSEKYGRLCLHISNNVLNNSQDAEECVNEAYHETWKTIPPKKPDSLMAYVCGIVRNISIDRLRHNSAKRRNSEYDICLDEVEDFLSDCGGIDDNATDDTVTEAIDQYVSSLGETDRIIVVRRFWLCDSYDEIARITKMNKAAVYKRISRIKKGLKESLTERGLIR